MGICFHSHTVIEKDNEKFYNRIFVSAFTWSCLG